MHTPTPAPTPTTHAYDTPHLQVPYARVRSIRYRSTMPPLCQHRPSLGPRISLHNTPFQFCEPCNASTQQFHHPLTSLPPSGQPTSIINPFIHNDAFPLGASTKIPTDNTRRGSIMSYPPHLRSARRGVQEGAEELRFTTRVAMTMTTTTTKAMDMDSGGEGGRMIKGLGSQIVYEPR
ncbi:hypothetical protein BDN70DRAFT_885739 [Pholiota conissans]|uniref:Uncharacterized protein n=1 Tax=Pholiota conissans TaxID=109636 RepID=A0A9P5YQZ5_9AGAR|nr:hypothetical protein BDN70DRAFT_885739 [Pholiota conissans]